MSQPAWVPQGGPTPAEILVVDDDEQGRRILGRILQGCGYICHLAADAREARHVLELMRPDLVLAGRITAIADTFDSLVSRRVYKEPIRVEPSLAVIRKGSGTQFDPNLLDLLTRSRRSSPTIPTAER
jgi:CheY-like chemotaxis protein